MPNCRSIIFTSLLALLAMAGCLGQEEKIDNGQLIPDGFTENPGTMRLQECDYHLTGNFYPGDSAPQRTPPTWNSGLYVASGINMRLFECKLVSLDIFEKTDVKMLWTSTLGRNPPQDCIRTQSGTAPAEMIYGIWTDAPELTAILANSYGAPAETMNLSKMQSDSSIRWEWSFGQYDNFLEMDALVEPNQGSNQEAIYLYWDQGASASRLEFFGHTRYANENQFPAIGDIGTTRPKLEREPNQWVGPASLRIGNFIAEMEIFEDYLCTPPA